jgi:N-acetylglucosaminyldiphosphoundecaprenol N-acetyl-beta-D-mannosaminyltransferase
MTDQKHGCRKLVLLPIMKRIPLGPVAVDLIDFPSLRAALRAAIIDNTPSQIVTLNALMFNLALHDDALAGIIKRAALIVPESSGICWAISFLSGAKTLRLPGIDLLHDLCRQAVVEGWRIYLLGAQPGIAEKAAEELQRLYPGLTVAGTQHGYFSPAEEQSVIQKIAAARPRILFAGLAIPHQEQWLAAHREELGVPLIMGVGGSYDVISGNLRRAPSWMQRCGIEWVYRTLQQPWRLLRIKDLPVFILNVVQLKIKLILE